MPLDLIPCLVCVLEQYYRCLINYTLDSLQLKLPSINALRNKLRY